MAHYPDVNPNPDFSRIEEEVLKYWETEGLFRRSVENRKGAKEFIFYDGPPFANGLPHYGHLLTGYVKDLFARYQTMKGKRVERRFGWDCHGLPAEMGSEKELGISGRAAIQNFGIDKFNEHCRTSVMKYTKEWEDYVTRQARWVDFKNDYKTMDVNFMESVLWAFKQLYDKRLVYEAYRVMPYSWAAETPLSNFETKLDNSYREREDKAVTVAFELNTPPKGAPKADKYYVLAWTTTPWTLPSNLALAVNPEMEYVCVIKNSSPLAGEHDAPKRVGGGKTDFATEKAQEMRKDPTDAEKKLWYRLSQEQLGYKFRRQQPVGNFIVDFYNAEKRLVIELDGGQHADNPKDAARTAWLKSQGLKVLRFWNNEVLENIEGVLAVITETLEKPPHAVSDETAAPPQGGSYGVCYILARNVLDTGKYDKELRFTIDASNLDEYLAEPATYNKPIDKQKYPYPLLMGSDLLGLSYHPLFPYFASHKHSFKILDGSSFVTDADGTGIVHMAPGFGEDDQKVCEKNGIEIVVPVDGQGKYTDAIFDLPGLKLKGLNVIAETEGQTADEPYKPEQVKKYGLVNLRIINWLKNTGKLIKQEEIKHNYPHCWRTDQPLIYRAMPSWYVEVTKFRDRAVELNKQINWIPEHIRDGQMGHMLATAPDWSISRNRFWGTPIPVWRSKSGKVKVFGSIAELEEASGKKIADLHRPFIDEIVITEGGEEYHRVEDVFDCWFESGSMPFAQVHYPFENKEWFEKHFPADFITEYVGQTRGWFNTLIMLSTALFDKAPFKNCICHGVVLDSETGLKYSKRLKNYKDPMEVMDKFGADALRWLMISSSVMRGMDLAVDPEGKFIRDVVRLAIKPIWNAYNFFTLYANADGLTANYNTDSGHLMDRYILAKCVTAVDTIEKSLDAYDTPTACDAVSQFFEVLNNWYIRRNKERFWKEEKDADKQAAYDTLYTVLTTMCRAAAPLLPLTCEHIYIGLTGGESIKKPSPSGRGLGEGKEYADKKLIENARSLRKNATDAEGLMWSILRDRQLENKKFRRQHPIGNYVLDFYCEADKFAIELDGGQHAEQKTYDDKRTEFLNEQGIKVLRFWNHDVMENIEGVVETILKTAPSPNPLPEGEGFSVHLAEFPNTSSFLARSNEKGIQATSLVMDEVRDACNAALSVRNTKNLRVRLPLQKLVLVSRNKKIMTELFDVREIIKDEVNIREVTIDDSLESYATFKLSINNPILGKRLPEKMKQIIPASKKGEWKQVDGAVEICGEKLLPGEYTLQLEPKPEYKDRAQALSTNDALVILDTTVTPELEAEGIARDMVRAIQQARKDGGLNVSDRIKLHLDAPDNISKAIATHRDYVMEQTLTVELLGQKPTPQDFSGESMVDDKKVVITLARAA